ncbi:hypothetical protein, partial [Ruthenibacterium lactatiformans]|uniref:hypothetical protein n=1 Tax=Ruthenibacterium lactatiformans TaxID=1550024 RepID=UPI003FD7BDF5
VFYNIVILRLLYRCQQRLAGFRPCPHHAHSSPCKKQAPFWGLQGVFRFIGRSPVRNFLKSY